MSFVADWISSGVEGVSDFAGQVGSAVDPLLEPAVMAVLAMSGGEALGFGGGEGGLWGGGGGSSWGGGGGSSLGINYPGMAEVAAGGGGGAFAPGGPDILEILKKYGMQGKSPFGAAMSVGSGLYGMKTSRDISKAAERAATMQDPFGPQRAQYQGQLSALMADPSKITTMPGYSAGLQAVERKMASQGYLGSGNMMTALSEYGGGFFDKEAARLATLAGANIAPSGGGALVTGKTAAADTASKALASMGFGARQIEQILSGR